MADQDAPQPPTDPQEDLPDPFIGRTLVGKFRLNGVLGTGAMGRVYEAEHLSLSKQIAVKVLHRHLMGDEGLARRFHREAKSASTLSHANSISIMDFGQDVDGTLYIAMELLDGRALGDVIETEGPLPLERTVRILAQVCHALDDAHHHNIVHRDLKAENVMVMDRRGEQDFVKVCDFGIAKVIDPKADNPDSAITVAGMVCGTPEYMSPEQARGEPLDGRSDLYSLGILLYYMITQRLPFTADSALGCVTKHLTEEPKPPRRMRPDLDIAPVLDRFVLRTIAKDPDDRPPTATAFRQELEGVAAMIARGEREVEPPPAASASPAEIQTELVTEGSRRRSGRWTLLVVVLLGLLLGGITTAFYVSQRPEGGGGGGAVARASGPDAAAPAPMRPVDAGVTVRRPADAGPAVAGPRAPDAAPPPPRTRRRRRRPGMRAMRPGPRTMRPAPMDPQPGKSPFQQAYDKARVAFNGGRVSEAARYYRAALRLRPGHAGSLKGLARCSVRLGRPCQALRYYRRYAKVRPGDYFAKRHIQKLSKKCGR